MTGSRTLITIAAAIAVALASFTAGYYGSPSRTYTVAESTTLTTTVTTTVTQTPPPPSAEKCELAVERAIYDNLVSDTMFGIVVLEIRAGYNGEGNWAITTGNFVLIDRFGNAHRPICTAPFEVTCGSLTVTPGNYTRFRVAFFMGTMPSKLIYNDTAHGIYKELFVPPLIYISKILVKAEVSGNVTGVYALGSTAWRYVASGDEMNETIRIYSQASYPVKVVGIGCKEGFPVRPLTQLPVVIMPGESAEVEIAVAIPATGFYGDIHIILYVEPA
ncbi:hypothetical protein [Desulfurococcus mucosus]|uniref:Uncharacterized protein n=1 Tax=Desulfurococcus mucosus (strain ATCC 35584 / DSM 2162 / JCM 9187 / O7/1) TaxID=765177 RepID=E8RAC1_DESM0|nr:hypothetical protein [Desulfurococcus mucosus]ADV65427.1 hypothetical protein Desmu_1125 [Desulfurococcus mucosus DSM 2162]